MKAFCRKAKFSKLKRPVCLLPETAPHLSELGFFFGSDRQTGRSLAVAVWGYPCYGTDAETGAWVAKIAP